jgi:hypothetical protein
MAAGEYASSAPRRTPNRPTCPRMQGTQDRPISRARGTDGDLFKRGLDPSLRNRSPSSSRHATPWLPTPATSLASLTHSVRDPYRRRSPRRVRSQLRCHALLTVGDRSRSACFHPLRRRIVPGVPSRSWALGRVRWWCKCCERRITRHVLGALAIGADCRRRGLVRNSSVRASFRSDGVTAARQRGHAAGLHAP